MSGKLLCRQQCYFPAYLLSSQKNTKSCSTKICGVLSFFCSNMKQKWLWLTTFLPLWWHIFWYTSWHVMCCHSVSLNATTAKTATENCPNLLATAKKRSVRFNHLCRYFYSLWGGSGMGTSWYLVFSCWSASWGSAVKITSGPYNSVMTVSKSMVGIEELPGCFPSNKINKAFCQFSLISFTCTYAVRSQPMTLDYLRKVVLFHLPADFCKVGCFHFYE